MPQRATGSSINLSAVIESQQEETGTSVRICSQVESHHKEGDKEFGFGVLRHSWCSIGITLTIAESAAHPPRRQQAGSNPLGRIVGKLDNETRKHLLADQCPVWAVFVKVNYF